MHDLRVILAKNYKAALNDPLFANGDAEDQGKSDSTEGTQLVQSRGELETSCDLLSSPLQRVCKTRFAEAL